MTDEWDQDQMEFTEVVFVRKSDFYQKMLEKFPDSPSLLEQYEKTKKLPGRYEPKRHVFGCRCPACVEHILALYDLNFCPPEDWGYGGRFK